MAQKTNIRSIRFSDELADLIDRQIGETFTAKFEALVTRGVGELPNMDKELAWWEMQIKDKRDQLMKMSAQAGDLGQLLNDLTYKTKALDGAVTRAVQKWGE